MGIILEHNETEYYDKSHFFYKFQEISQFAQKVLDIGF